jgi:peptide/nickel transport system permease protein
MEQPPQGAGAAWLRAAGRFGRHRPLGIAGAVVIAVMVAAAVSAPALAPYGPLETDYSATLRPPGQRHWLGTDAFGRDLLSRLIYGAQTALLVAFTSSFVGTSLGAIVGVGSAYFGGRLDLWLQRILEILLSMPFIILALAVVAAIGSGVINVIVALTVPTVPSCARVIRSTALAIREMPYVEAATACGSGHGRVMFRHMIPNVMTPYLVLLTAYIGQAILLEASLSYLGLGVAEPTPAWGLMLRGAATQFAESAPWIPVFPGVAITLAVFAFNLFGDSIRDALDPRLRSKLGRGI